MPDGEPPDILLKRAYDAPDEADGARILVDRIWPRGVTRQALQLDDWIKEIAPSTALRRWFGHDPAKWETFQVRYGQELAAQPAAVTTLLQRCRKQKTTLIYAAKDRQHNNAVVLKAYLERRAAEAAGREAR